MNAVIFDMDGVIVDSEPLWKKAEREVFSALGVKVTPELCELTQKMTTDEVTKFWFDRNPWTDKPLQEVENAVIDRVIALIASEDCIISGVSDLIDELKARGFKLALATNSPYRIIPTVLDKLNLSKAFHTISSAEFEKKGKPEPDVYLSTLEKLKEKAHKCIVVEDSNSGIIAAKKAGMKVIAFTNNDNNLITQTVDYKIASFEKVDFSIFDHAM